MKKIAIVTVYDAVDNLGSFLQAHALSIFLTQSGYSVSFLPYRTKLKAIAELFKKLPPYRSLFTRISRISKFLKAWRLLKIEPIENASSNDLIIYGSDEIWNMDNPYFAVPFFFGGTIRDRPKLAYAISVGAMKESTLEAHEEIASHISAFRYICVRDEYTKHMLLPRFDVLGLANVHPVCDPTLLLPLEAMEQPVRQFKKPYLLVYSYGIDSYMIGHLRRFAKEKGLILVSASFWHPWVDKVWSCSPMEFSYIIRHAEYVFTTTFHGAIFAMRNHKRCAILPAREKVRHVVETLGAQQHMVRDECTYDTFCRTITRSFDSATFEKKLAAWQSYSIQTLLTAINKYA